MTTILREQLSDVIRCALEASIDPAMAAADWLARDIRHLQRIGRRGSLRPAGKTVRTGIRHRRRHQRSRAPRKPDRQIVGGRDVRIRAPLVTVS